MTQNTVSTSATSDDVQRAIAALPRTARAGGMTANAMMVRAGLALLGRIRRAFITKARGGTDEAGDRWKPLAPITVALRGINPTQKERWWAVYRRALRQYPGNKGHAAAVAWAVLKKEFCTVPVDRYGRRQVEILRDTGLLLNSLSPGVQSTERVLEVGPGVVTVGTNRKGAMRHHRGIPGRLPQRRLWPPVSRWPPNWWADVLDQIKQGLVDLVVENIRGTK